MITRRLRMWALWLALFCACGESARSESEKRARERGPVVVYAASSLRDALSEIARLVKRSEQVDLRFSFGGSNALAQQISAAPRADVFLSANAEWVAFLKHKNLVLPGSEREFLANELVVVGHAQGEGAPTRLEELHQGTFKFLAVGDPNAVPAGKYARAALSRVRVGDTDLWRALVPRIVPTPDVRAALALVESDPRGLGVVYRSDVLSSKHARVLFALSETGPEDRVRYYAAVIQTSPRPRLATRIVEALVGERAQAVFEKHGFVRLSKATAEPLSGAPITP